MFKLFHIHGAERTFHIIDSILIEDSLRQGETEHNDLKKKRAQIHKIYDRIVFADGSSDDDFEDGPRTTYPDNHYDGIDENGIPGMPPMGE